MAANISAKQAQNMAKLFIADRPATNETELRLCRARDAFLSRFTATPTPTMLGNAEQLAALQMAMELAEAMPAMFTSGNLQQMEHAAFEYAQAIGIEYLATCNTELRN